MVLCIGVGARHLSIVVMLIATVKNSAFYECDDQRVCIVQLIGGHNRYALWISSLILEIAEASLGMLDAEGMIEGHYALFSFVDRNHLIRSVQKTF